MSFWHLLWSPPPGKAIGIDMTPDMIERARTNARNGGYQNVDFYLGTIDDLPLADGLLDCVISNCVINLAPDVTAHWGVLDPAADVGTPEQIDRAFRDTFSILDRRISLFLSLASPDA